MIHAVSVRIPPIRLGFLTVGAVIAALLSAPTVMPAHATTGDRTVALTLTCKNTSCSGSWFWHQGGITGPLLASGTIAGALNSTTKETTTQPAAADTLNFGVKAGTTSGCGRGFIEYIAPGSAVNFTATVPRTDSDGDAICLGAGSSFNMRS